MSEPRLIVLGVSAWQMAAAWLQGKPALVMQPAGEGRPFDWQAMPEDTVILVFDNASGFEQIHKAIQAVSSMGQALEERAAGAVIN